jgi:hypothetical protein
MYSQDAQDKFVELRAQGWTLPHIATELHISRRTLVEWGRHYATDIQAMRAEEAELLKEKFLASREEDLNRLARLQKDVEDELSNRELKFIPIEKLFRLATELRQQIKETLQNNSDDQSPLPAAHSENGTIAGSGH